MAQTRPSSDPNLNRTTTPNTTTQPATTQQPTTTPNNTNTNSNSTLNNQANPVTTENNSNINNDPNTTGSLNTTSANAAYSVSVPASVQTSFQTAYPAIGTSTVIWSQSGDWYRARYMENGKVMEASYREDGKTVTRQAGPQLRTYVPEETVNRALQTYGVNLYAIALAKGVNGENVYNVTVIENGQSRTEWMNEDGSSVTSPYRTEMDNQQPASTEMNNGQTTPATGTVDQTDATNSTNSSTPATTDDYNNTMDDQQPQQQTLEQGENPQQVDPDNNMNKEGLNNGQTSESLLKERGDEMNIVE